MQILTVGLLLLLQVELGIVLWAQRGKFNKANPVFIDTSVLMDGRIVAIVQSGFIPNRLYIPASVLRELQLVADGSDNDKRARARHGLDIANELAISGKVKIFQDTARNGVDESLLELARRRGGRICTIDFNLNKVASAQGIKVLNVHEIAQSLRASHLPGERVSITIIQKGNDARQGVGYLADGTMVVVDGGGKDIGKVASVEIIRSIQTTAGRMLFAKKNETSRASVKQHTRNTLSGKKPSAEDSLMALVETQQ